MLHPPNTAEQTGVGILTGGAAAWAGPTVQGGWTFKPMDQPGYLGPKSAAALCYNLDWRYVDRTVLHDLTEVLMLSTSRRGLLPPDLARRVSPWMLLFNRREGNLLGFTVATLSLLMWWATNRNGFALLAIAWICPSLAALFFLSVPLKPYRGGLFAGRREVDAGDPRIVRLVEICNSDGARRHIRRNSLKISCILFVVLGGIGLLLRRSLRWGFPPLASPFLWVVVGFWCLGCGMAQAIDYTVWCLTTWAKREEAHSREAMSNAES